MSSCDAHLSIYIKSQSLVWDANLTDSFSPAAASLCHWSFINSRYGIGVKSRMYMNITQDYHFKPFRSDTAQESSAHPSWEKIEGREG